MATLIRNITNLVTCRNTARKPKSGKRQSDIGLIKNGYLMYEKDKIIFSGSFAELRRYLKTAPVKIKCEIDSYGKTVMPGFIDTHTHLVFAGSRANEYEMRISGRTYEEIAAAGGGIKSTVKAVRKASEDYLKVISKKRLSNFLMAGTTTLEAKSGYGLDKENEIKMLEVINEIGKNNTYGQDIYPTFLGAHAVPPGYSKKEYIDLICYEMIPEIAKRKLAVFIDVFCEKNYFSPAETDRILSTGAKFGLIPKLHTDQFNSIGGIDIAIKNHAVSVDHLEVLKAKDIKKLSEYGKTVATLLPGVSYFLDIPYPPARKLIENNVPVAIATDFNPGSCMTENIQMIMSFASVKMRMSAEEIINAATINAAYAIFSQDKIGSLEPGKQADILIFDFPSYKDLIYNFANNRLETVIKKGYTAYNLKKN
jgi:imidazolonepropionase